MRDRDTALLTRLLEIDTVTPMETGRPSAQPHALEVVIDAAADVGFEVEHFGPAAPEVLADQGAPLPVQWRAREMGTDAFLAAQPNAVLRLGPRRPADQTLMFNCHIDTVSGHLPVRLTARRAYGRGAVDAKGQVVALLGGVRLAQRREPGLLDRVSLLIQVVGGEEGGAMGWYGTRELARLGYLGRLNVVAEPTCSGALDRTSTSMTARFEVDGDGSTDDVPEAGHNATIALAVITDHLVRELYPQVRDLGGTMCVAGCDTGREHNRVYGKGALLVNFAYPDLDAAAEIRRRAEVCFTAALARLTADYGRLGIARVTAKDAERICRLRWLKSGLPVLRNDDQAMTALLAEAGIPRHDEHSEIKPFTCDAMWLAAAGSHTVVLGAGELSGNGAHTDDEYVSLADLDAHAERVASLIVAFSAWQERRQC